MARQLTLSFENVAALEKELSLRLLRGEARVLGVTGLGAFTPCELVIHHPDGREPLTVGATVMSSPEDQKQEGLVRLMLDEGSASVLKDLAVSHDVPRGAEPPTEAPESEDGASLAEASESEDGASLAPATMPPQLRLRQLTIKEQMKLARLSPSLTERTALERILGKNGWEPLLGNSNITIPEVARIGRKGNAPRPLLERIVGNRMWAGDATVRRALLTNPKLTPDLITKVLRLAPASEVKLLLKQTAYPMTVRTVAERLMGRS